MVLIHKNSFKIGIRFKLDFFRDFYTFDYYFFSSDKEIKDDIITYSYIILFMGFVIHINK
jgi:hypothetical protein